MPTLDKDALESLDVSKIYNKFKEALDCFVSKNIDKTLILDHCFITPSCGCGSLNIEMAKKALMLSKELSEALKKENGVKL